MASPRGTAPVVRAAGVLPWRVQDAGLQVAMVHRPKYDDWSWAKGKLDPGEEWAVTAVREAREETGLSVRLGLPLPPSVYPVSAADGTSGGEASVVKQVRYWAGQVLHDRGALEHEVDRVDWVSPTLAARRLSYRRDHEQLDALLAAHRAGRLAVWPLLLVRHAKALARGDWSGPDAQRPLSTAGRRRAERMVPLLAAYGVEHVLSSSATRCVDTVVPYLKARPCVELERRRSLSEEGYEAGPDKARRHLDRLLAEARAAAMCSHGPVFPDLLERLGQRCEAPARKVVREAARANLGKGEVLTLMVCGRGETARVVAAERHRPPRG